MHNNLLYFLAILGMLFLFMIIVVFGMYICYIIKDFIADQFQKYTIKRRFKKKPIAKCYCRDCKLWNPKTGECYDHCNLRYMGPSWFCCFAEPLTGKNFIERENYLKEKIK